MNTKSKASTISPVAVPSEDVMVAVTGEEDAELSTRVTSLLCPSVTLYVVGSN